MKVVILAGGYGTRISEESAVRPKPMVEIGGYPILWHIMKIYSAAGLTDFIVCLGYKGQVIKEYFANYFLRQADLRLDLRENQMEILSNGVEPWRVSLIDTGEATMSGGRLKRVSQYLKETFCFTYGDNVSDLAIQDLITFHRQQGVVATLTGVQPPGRFGVFSLKEGSCLIEKFREKPEGEGAWINGGFFVLEPDVVDYISGDSSVWELEPLQQLAREGNLAAYKHDGFWQNMDTLRDKHVLEDLWKQERPPWKTW
jgi:glucose-1-phosphate cytidylyltransferase